MALAAALLAAASCSFMDRGSAFRKACGGGDMGACAALGVLEHKKGNPAQASRLVRKACGGGHAGGCAALGVLEFVKGNAAGAL